MNYYSTNHKAPTVTLKEAVVKGLAPDKGLYMPCRIPQLSKHFFEQMPNMSLQEISYTVASALFGEDVPQKQLKEIVYDAMSFDIPLVKVADRIYSLELFHGPTLAFKDVGGRFMARLLGYFTQDIGNQMLNVLVATSGDTGSAVANGFLGVKGVRVFVLYPKGKVSEIQEKQFASLGNNITSLAIDGTFDDCQRLVKQAFLDSELNNNMNLTSANSINIARFMPQSFYYFYACAQLRKIGVEDMPVFSVPSGNLGNITAGLLAHKMGLPVKRFIAANNRNDVFFNYLKTGEYAPKPSVKTLANAMDVGDPSNFARILDLFDHSHEQITQSIAPASYTDEMIAQTIKDSLQKFGYLPDPHGACGLRALQEGMEPTQTGIFLETAHAAKFAEIVEPIIGTPIAIPEHLQKFLNSKVYSTLLGNDFEEFKAFLLRNA